MHDESEADQINIREITMEVTETEQAISILKTEFQINAQLENGILSFQGEKEAIPTIITAFVNHQIDIYQVGAKRATLEDKFFDMIGENSID